MNIQVKVIDILNEDAYASASSVGGMGNITPAQPSTNAGCTTGSDFTSGGGTVGSGDVSNPMSIQRKDGKGKKKKKGKKFSEVFDLKQNWTKGADKPPKLKSFNDFNVNKVTHLN